MVIDKQDRDHELCMALLQLIWDFIIISDSQLYICYNSFYRMLAWFLQNVGNNCIIEDAYWTLVSVTETDKSKAMTNI